MNKEITILSIIFIILFIFSIPILKDGVDCKYDDCKYAVYPH